MRAENSLDQPVAADSQCWQMNLLAGASAAGLVFAAGACDTKGSAARAHQAALEPSSPAPGVAPAPTPSPSAATGGGASAESADSAAPLRFLIIGGGPTPESNEVSLEQDVELARRV